MTLRTLLFLLLAAAPAAAYDLDSGDVLELRVRHLLAEPDRVTVDPDGRIPVPMLGMVRVSGMTSEAAGAALRDLYVSRRLLVAPDLTLALVAGRPIYIEGDVRQPGAYPYTPEITVQQAVALAGGYRIALFPSDPAIVASDAAAAYRSAVRDGLAAGLRAARLSAELDGAESFGNPAPGDPAARAQYARELEALEVANRQWRDELEQLGASLEIADEEIAAIEARKRELARLVDLQEEEVERYRQITSRGFQPITSLREAERSAAASRSELLEQDVLIAQAKERRSAAKLTLKNRAAERRMDLIEGIVANRGEAARQRAQAGAAAAKLAYSGRLARAGGGADGSLAVELGVKHRGSAESLAASEDTVLRPGDTIKVTVPLPAGLAAATSEPTGE